MRAVDWILRAEALALFVGGIVAFLAMGGNALWLLPLLLVPDVSMVGYLAGPGVGAATYNAGHNLVLALGIGALGWLLPAAPLALLGAVLVAHVGMDRSLGYGLKLPSDFRDTHLGRIGRP